MRCCRLPLFLALAALALGGQTLAQTGPSARRHAAVPGCFLSNQAASKAGAPLVGDCSVSALFQTARGRVLFTPAGLSVGVPVGRGRETAPGNPRQERRTTEAWSSPLRQDEPENAQLVVMGLGFGPAGRRPAPRSSAPRLAEPQAGRVNFLVGPREQWRTDLPTYGKLVYEGVWEGVDVAYVACQDRLECRYVVHPGGGPDAIVLAAGPGRLRRVGADRLAMEAAGARLSLDRLEAWQESGGRRVPVDVRFRVDENGRGGFRTGTYDASADLVIAPVLSWSTYLGPEGEESGGTQGYGVAVDRSGCAVVTGTTSSSSFPTTAGAYAPVPAGAGDIFVTKLDPAGSSLVYSTFIGGSGEDFSEALALDAAGNAYVSGYTRSSDFPTTAGTFSRTFQAEVNAYTRNLFVLKLNAEGTALAYSTFLSLAREGTDIAVDASGCSYVTGTTTYAGFPATPGAFDTSFNHQTNDGHDAFLTKLNADGTGLAYSTFLGSPLNDFGCAVAVDAEGCAYVMGETQAENFPTTPGAYDTTFNWYYDIYVTKLNPAGSVLVYSTYLGGKANENGGDIAVDDSGCAYVTGKTNSPDFPTTPGAFEPSHDSGSYTAFVSKLDSQGGHLVFSTYLGGTKTDFGTGLAMHPDGDVSVVGQTESPDFPTTADAFDPTFDGETEYGNDVFYARLNATGTSLEYATFLGGWEREYASAVAVDETGSAYVTGATSSFDFPTTSGAFGRTLAGVDAFVTKFAAADDSVVYSTFLGGDNASDHEEGRDVAVDGNRNVYVTGVTYSGHFPATPGAYVLLDYYRAKDVFVTKMNPDGTSLVYSTFFGGCADDESKGLALDGQGCAYLTGNTRSFDFPVTPGAYDATLANYKKTDVFALKLNATGSDLVYSTLLGGIGVDTGIDIAVAESGCAVIAGTTDSPDFPTSPGAWDASPNGDTDVFVFKLNAAGDALVFSTVLGGAKRDECAGIALGAGESPIVAGRTVCADFPVTSGAFDTTFNGTVAWTTGDAFVARLNPEGSALEYSTFLGGADDESVGGVAVGRDGSAYVAGGTRSTDFPTTPGAYDTAFGGWTDAFVARLDPAGSALLYSTFLGGWQSGYESAVSIVVDETGGACVAGYTASPDFPVTPDAFRSSLAGTSDSFLSRLDPGGAALRYSSFFGGSGASPDFDSVVALALDRLGAVCAVGTSFSPDFPVTPGAYDTVNPAGHFDAFVFKLTFPPSGDLNLDGAVDGADLALLAAYLAGGAGAIPDAAFRADLDLDGRVTALDLAILLLRVAG